MYTQHLIAGWGDMDFNSHMRNTAYLDKAADVRMMFFASNGCKLAARVTSTGGGLDLKQRRLICPPPSLLDALKSLDKSKDFQMLPSSVDTDH